MASKSKDIYDIEMLTGSFKFPSLLSVAKYKSWYQAEQETCFRLTTFICNTTSSSSLSFFYSRFFAVLNQADNLIINKMVTPIKAKKRKKILFANHYLTWCLWLCWFFFSLTRTSRMHCKVCRLLFVFHFAFVLFTSLSHFWAKKYACKQKRVIPYFTPFSLG